MTARRAIGFALLACCLALNCGDSGVAPEPASELTARGPNVLLITVDTLRADRLGCYGYELPTSPNIDRLAASGVRFSDATVQWPKTWPSMASLLAGAQPKTIGIRYRQQELNPDLLLMGEIFRDAGYRTGAVVANFNVGRRFGFDQGFDSFVESWQAAWARKSGNTPFRPRVGEVKRYTNATIVTDQALSWLDSGEAEPFFLWLHYIDPHGPYTPPRSYAELFQDAHPAEPIAPQHVPRYQVLIDPGTKRPSTDLGYYRAQYDRSVRYLDDELGRLFDGLEQRGIDRRETLIVLSADHGESFNEHDYYLEHGEFSYQASAHVPLIFAREGQLPAGRVIQQPVGLIDAAATLLELAGIDPPATYEGQSLRPLIEGAGGDSAPPFVFMESGYHEPTQLAVRREQWKLIHHRAGEDRTRRGEFELYDVIEDPHELHDLSAEHPDVVQRLSLVLDAWYSGGPRWDRGEEVDLETLDPAEVEMLRSLGYVQ